MSDFPKRTRLALLPLTKQLRTQNPGTSAIGAPVQDYVRADLHDEAIEALKAVVALMKERYGLLLTSSAPLSTANEEFMRELQFEIVHAESIIAKAEDDHA